MFRTWTNQQKLGVIVVLLPIFMYFGAMVHFAVNIPIGDDFNNILAFLLFDVEDKFKYLFSQHNEHRLFFNRIVAWFFYTLQGNVNFSSLIYFANFALLCIFALLVKAIPTQRNLLFLLPVALLIFSLRNWENMTWAMSGLQNFYVIVFAMCALYNFNEKTSTGFIASLLFASLATYTSGSGILCFIVMLLWFLTDYLLVKQYPSTPRYSNIQFIIFVMAFLAIATSYFVGYTKPTDHPELSFNLVSIGHFLTLLGGYANATFSVWSMFWGAVSLLLFVWITLKKSYIKYPFLYFCILFILGSLLIVSITRSGFGIGQALSSRYVILSALLISLLYVLVLELMPKLSTSRYFLGIVITLCIAANLATFDDSNEKLLRRKDTLENVMVEWLQDHDNVQVLKLPDGTSLPFIFYCLPANVCNKIITASIERGIYKTPVMQIQN